MTSTSEQILKAPHMIIEGPTDLPAEPLVVIRPKRGWVAIGLRELWHYRDLFYILALRDIKVRYELFLLVATWPVMEPLFRMLSFCVFFGRLAGMPSDGISYPRF